MENPVIKSCEQFLQQHVFKDVRIAEENFEELNVFLQDLFSKKKRDGIPENEFTLCDWHCPPMNPKNADLEALKWIFVVDTLNFCFWLPDSAPYVIEYRGAEHKGYWALCACIFRAIEELNIPITNCEYLASDSFTRETMKLVFPKCISKVSGELSEVMLLEERYLALKEAGTVICKYFEGCVSNLVESCDHSGILLALKLASYFKSYRDIFEYTSDYDKIAEDSISNDRTKNLAIGDYNLPKEGETDLCLSIMDKYPDKNNVVFYLKRAQIFVAEVYHCFAGKSYGQFNDIDKISIFADYRVPQMLAEIGILKYSPELMKLLADPHHIIERGSVVECEIRVSAIVAVNKFINLWNKRKNNIKLTSVSLDFLLWDAFKTIQSERGGDSAHYGGLGVPMHRTIGYFY